MATSTMRCARPATVALATVTVTVTVSMLALAGCSGASSGAGSGSVSTSSTTAGAATPSPTITYKPGDPKGMGAWAVLGLVNTRTTQERAVAEAYLRMDNVVLQALNTHVVDEAAFASVLESKALQDAKAKVERQIERKVWTIDQSTLNVLSIQMSGQTAMLQACNYNGTNEIDTTGKQIVPPPGSTGVFVMMVQRDGVWRVVGSRADTAKCDAVAIMEQLKTSSPTTH